MGNFKRATHKAVRAELRNGLASGETQGLEGVPIVDKSLRD
jgi:hypothetical protein